MNRVGVAVIGPCASGKSSVAAGLSKRGLNAWSVGQEHSSIVDLWNRRNPDYLVFLEISLTTLRNRRNNENWPAWIYDLQLKRLAHGRLMSNVIIDTNVLNLQQVIGNTQTEISRLHSDSSSYPGF